MSRIVAALGVLIFSGCAIVQANDPDALVWIMAYGYAAVICALALLGMNVSLGAVIGIIGFGMAAVTIYPFGDDRYWLEIEAAREGAGLALAAAWLGLVVGLDHWRRHRPATT